MLAQRGAGDSRRKRKDIPETIELAIGMKILSPEEPPLGDTSIITLKHLPQCFLVKLARTRAARFDGLDNGVVPIFPAKSSKQITVAKKAKTVTHLQYPATAAYCFTEYRSQGQTILHVTVNIASPPSGKLSFNLYVALSRNSGRGTIRLLREFDDDIFFGSARAGADAGG